MAQRCLRVSLAARCSISAILDEQRADEQLPLGTSELPDLPDKVPYHLALLFQSSKQLRGKKGSSFAEEQHTHVCRAVAVSVAFPKASLANLGFVCTYLLPARARSSPDILFSLYFFLIVSTSLIIPCTFLSAPSCTCPPGTGSFANHTAN